MQEGLTGLASKPGDTGLTGLALKIGGGLGAVKVRAKSTWCHRETCVEAKRSREGGVSVRDFYKKLDEFAPAWAIIVINSVGVFLSSGANLEDKKMGIGSHPTWPFIFQPPFSCSSLFSSPLLHLGLVILDGFLRDWSYGFMGKEVLPSLCHPRF